MVLERHKFTSLIRGCVLQKARHPPALQMLKSSTVKHIDCSLNWVPQLVVIVWCWKSWILLNPQWRSRDRVPKLEKGQTARPPFWGLQQVWPTGSFLLQWGNKVTKMPCLHVVIGLVAQNLSRSRSPTVAIPVPLVAPVAVLSPKLSCPMCGLKGLLPIHTSVRNKELYCVLGSWFS